MRSSYKWLQNTKSMKVSDSKKVEDSNVCTTFVQSFQLIQVSAL
jgi:hypothetical protein